MQRVVGDNPFFLPTRKLGQLLGAHWASVARWLMALDTLGVIRLAAGEVRKRGGGRSPRYHYGACGLRTRFSSAQQQECETSHQRSMPTSNRTLSYAHRAR